MKRTKLWLYLAAGLAITGCKKEEPAAKDKPEQPSNAAGGGAPADDKGKPPPVTKPAGAPTPEAKAERFHECMAAITAGNEEAVGGCYSADAVVEDVSSFPEAKVSGPDAIKGLVKGEKAVFPDLAVVPQLVLIDGENRASIVMVTGSHKGPLLKLAPTEKRIGIFQGEIGAMGDDGKISRQSFYTDQPTLFHQLGVADSDSSPDATETGLWEPQTVIAKHDDAEKANLALVQKHIDAVNAGDPKAIEPLVGDEVELVFYGDKEEVKGKKTYLEQIAERMGQTKGGKIEVKAMWSAGDWVVIEQVFRGALAKDIPGTKGTKGKTLELSSLVFFKIANAKIAQHHIFTNTLTPAVQLGLVNENDPFGIANPPPGEGGGEPPPADDHEQPAE